MSLKLQCVVGSVFILVAIAAVVSANVGGECHARVEWQWLDQAHTMAGPPSAVACTGTCAGGGQSCGEGSPAGMPLVTTCACGGEGGTMGECNAGWAYEPSQVQVRCFRTDDCPGGTPVCTAHPYTIEGGPGQNDIGGFECDCFVD